MDEIDRKIGGFTLSFINAKPNRRKSELYWIGFLSGLLASGRLEASERFPLIAEAEHFFNCLADPDAYELVQDLGCSDAYSNDEIFDLIEQIVEVRSKTLGELKIRDMRWSPDFGQGVKLVSEVVPIRWTGLRLS
jgi:hypothetical protein